MPTRRPASHLRTFSRLQLCQQVLRMDRLRQDFELVALGTGVFEQIGGGGLSGKEQNLATGQELTDVYGGFNAIHVRHDHVTYHKVGTNSLGTFDGCGSRINGSSVEPMLIQDDSQS